MGGEAPLRRPVPEPLRERPRWDAVHGARRDPPQGLGQAAAAIPPRPCAPPDAAAAAAAGQGRGRGPRPSGRPGRPCPTGRCCRVILERPLRVLLVALVVLCTPTPDRPEASAP